MKQDPHFPNLSILNHPLIQHKLVHMRDKDMSTCTSHELLRKITLLVGYETTRNLPLASRHIGTSMDPIRAPVIMGRKPAVVSVLRVGVGMSDGLIEPAPSARIGHIGAYHDGQHRPVEYLVRLPNLEDHTSILCDPMVITGCSVVHAADMMKKRGVPDENVLLLALMTASEGVGVSQKAHPGAELFVTPLDSYLDKNTYTIPGLGDAGDRLSDTRNQLHILSANKNSRQRRLLPLVHRKRSASLRPTRSTTQYAVHDFAPDG